MTGVDNLLHWAVPLFGASCTSQPDETPGRIVADIRESFSVASAPSSPAAASSWNRRRRTPVRRIQVDLTCFHFSDYLERLMQQWFDRCIQFLAESHVSSETVYRLSVVAIGLHMTFHEIARLLRDMPLEKVSMDSSAVLSWLIPLLAIVISLSFIMVVWMKFHPTQAVVMVGLVTLFLVECLFPVTVAICVVFFLSNFVSFLDAMVVSVSMLTVSAISSWCIRAVLYPSLGFAS